MSKKRNKQYNPFKVGEKMMRKGLANLGVFYSDKGINGDKRCIMVDYRDAHKFRVTESAARAIANIEHPWNIYCIATGFESNGKERLSVHIVDANNRIYQSEPEFLRLINEAHEALAEEFSQYNRLTNLSWLAQPNGEHITNEQIDLVVKEYGAW